MGISFRLSNLSELCFTKETIVTKKHVYLLNLSKIFTLLNWSRQVNLWDFDLRQMLYSSPASGIKPFIKLAKGTPEGGLTCHSEKFILLISKITILNIMLLK